ncbi:MAG: 4-hydroxy-tetrahydrodipicolinate synthase, partial [Proteobacteria bacterium]|nr:4-hydroxy-tetrahydrodipicolinate synthase [Pseudomonadota bacterium]
VKVIVGTGQFCAEKVIQDNQIAHQMGADAVLVVTPYYIRTTQSGLQKHYQTIADNTELPIILYNVPTRTQNDLLPQTAAKLAQHSRIIGIKEAVSENDRINELIKKCPIDFAILSGDDDSFCDSIQNGAHGVISVASNIRPQVVTEICNYLALGDVISAKKLNSSLDNLYKMLSCQPNPIPVKYLMHKAGLIDNGIRLPLLWMDKVWMDKNMTGSESEIKQIIKEYKI